MDPLLSRRDGSNVAAVLALEHVVALSTGSSHFYWWFACTSSTLGLAVTELHSWTLLMTRSVTGCAAGAGVIVPANATLTSCAELGYFEGGNGLATVTTNLASPIWSIGVWLSLAAVVFQWVWAVDVITGQTWRAGALFPYGIFLRASKFNT